MEDIYILIRISTGRTMGVYQQLIRKIDYQIYKVTTMEKVEEDQ